METKVERIRNKEKLSSTIRNHQKTVTIKLLSKKDWIQKYALRMYRSFSRWQSPLGMASEYIEQIKKDLEEFYEDPLKRLLIEGSF